MDLTFQVPKQYFSLEHQTLLLSQVTSTAGYCFCFGSISSFFLELFLHWSPVAWTGMGEFNSDDHYIYYCGQESLRRKGVAIMVHKRVQNAVLGCNLINNRMISVRFQGKPFNITVIQAYAPNSNAEGAQVEWFYKDLQDLLELTPKRCPFHYRGLECKTRKSRNTWSNRHIWPWSME